MPGDTSSTTLQLTNQSVIAMLVCLFALWRVFKSSSSTLNIFKGRLRSIGTIFMIISVLSSAAYMYLLAFLSTRLDIDKLDFQHGPQLDQQFILAFKEYKLDLLTLVFITYQLSKVFKVSAAFLLVGLWAPCAFSAFNSKVMSLQHLSSKNEKLSLLHVKSLFKTSIVTFSKIYALLRIFIISAYYYSANVTRASLFIENTFLANEVYLCVLFIIILQTKHGFLNKYRALDTTNLLTVCLSFYGLLTYSLNTIALPVDLSELQKQIIESLTFSVDIILSILLISMFCPMKEQLFDSHYDEEECKELTVPKIQNIEQMENEGHFVGHMISIEAKATK